MALALETDRPLEWMATIPDWLPGRVEIISQLQEKSLSLDAAETAYQSRASEALGAPVLQLSMDVFQAIETTPEIAQIRTNVEHIVAREVVTQALVGELARRSDMDFAKVMTGEITYGSKNGIGMSQDMITFGDKLRAQADSIMEHFGITADGLFSETQDIIHSVFENNEQVSGLAIETGRHASGLLNDLSTDTAHSLVYGAAGLVHAVDIQLRNETTSLLTTTPAHLRRLNHNVSRQLDGVIQELVTVMGRTDGSALEQASEIQKHMIKIEGLVHTMMYRKSVLMRSGKSQWIESVMATMDKPLNHAIDSYTRWSLPGSLKLKQYARDTRRNLSSDPGNKDGKRKPNIPRIIGTVIGVGVGFTALAPLFGCTGMPQPTSGEQPTALGFSATNTPDVPTLIPTIVPTPVEGLAFQPMQNIVIDGAPPNPVGDSARPTFLTSAMKDTLFAAGFSPYVYQGNANNITRNVSGDGLCAVPVPDRLYNPNIVNQVETKLGNVNGIVKYGIEGGNPQLLEATDQVLTQVAGVVPIDKDTICIMTRANEGNPDGFKPGTLRILRYNVTTNTITGEMAGGYSPTAEFKILWTNNQPQMVTRDSADAWQPVQFTDKLFSIISTPTVLATSTIVPTPSFTPEPSRTPIPDFPHKIENGKIVFDWSADLSAYPDITKGGSIPITKELIFNWMNSLNSQGLNSPMPTADTVCKFNWLQSHTGGDAQISQLLILNANGCTKDTSPVQVRAASRAHGNLQAEDGNWYSIDVVIFAYRVFTTDDPNGFIDIPVVLAQSSDYIRDGHIKSFNNPTRYLGIDFKFSNSKLPALNAYAPQGVARYLQSTGIYDQNEVDNALSQWLKVGQPTKEIKDKILVGSAGSLNNFISP